MSQKQERELHSGVPTPAPAGPARFYCLTMYFSFLSENILQFPVYAVLITFSNTFKERWTKREMILRTKDSSWASGYWTEKDLLLKRDLNSDLNRGVLIICSSYLCMIALAHSKFLWSQSDVREMIINNVGFQQPAPLTLKTSVSASCLFQWGLVDYWNEKLQSQSSITLGVIQCDPSVTTQWAELYISLDCMSPGKAIYCSGGIHPTSVIAN